MNQVLLDKLRFSISQKNEWKPKAKLDRYIGKFEYVGTNATGTRKIVMVGCNDAAVEESMKGYSTSITSVELEELELKDYQCNFYISFFSNDENGEPTVPRDQPIVVLELDEMIARRNSLDIGLSSASKMESVLRGNVSNSKTGNITAALRSGGSIAEARESFKSLFARFDLANNQQNANVEGGDDDDDAAILAAAKAAKAKAGKK